MTSDASQLDADSPRNGGYSTGGYSTGGYSGSTGAPGTTDSSSYAGTSYGGDSYPGSSGGYGSSYSTSYGGDSYAASSGGDPGSYSGSTYGGSYSASYGSESYSGSTYGGSYSTSYGSESYSGSTYGDSYSGSTGYGSDTTPYTSTSTATMTSGGTGDDVWYGVPTGTLITGVQADAYDNDDCSGPVESGQQLESVCEDAAVLKYPSHEACTAEPEWSTQNCDTWCTSEGLGAGACEVVTDGPDRCACERRTDVGVDPGVPGCVAEYAASDQSCEGEPVEFHLATCGPVTANRTVAETLHDRRLDNPTCSDDPILEPDVNCHDWCETNGPDPQFFGYCELVESDDCGGAPAAKCTCAPLEHAVSTVAGGAACWQTYDHADTCDDQETAFATLKSQCEGGGRLRTFATQNCSDVEPTPILRDCDDHCPANMDGVCAGGDDITCPNGDEIQVASCVCVPKP